MTWNEGPLLGFDLETTGVNPGKDLPVQVAFVRFEPPNKSYRNVFVVNPGCEVPPGAEAIHGISTQRARREGCPLSEAAAIVHSVLERAQADRVPVVAMNASFDITIATLFSRRFDLSPISWHALIDPLVIDRQVDRYRTGQRRLHALCCTYGVCHTTPHDAGSDADATVAIAGKIAALYPAIAALEIEELTQSQVEWHRAWAVEYDSWCRENGRLGLAPEEFCWPLREAFEPHVAV